VLKGEKIYSESQNLNFSQVGGFCIRAFHNKANDRLRFALQVKSDDKKRLLSDILFELHLSFCDII
jgi:hypothetical protein